MEIITRQDWIRSKLRTATFQDPFPEETDCSCGHRMLPVLLLVDDEGYLAGHRPQLKAGEFWFHDAVAIAVYLCLDPACGRMSALWNQA